MDWQLTECDINKDIKVSDYFHYTGIKIQVRHLDHLFIIYIKSMGKDTVCRLEERKHPNNKSAVEFICDVFNPTERFENQIAGMEKTLNGIALLLEDNHYNYTKHNQSLKDDPLRDGVLKKTDDNYEEK